MSDELRALLAIETVRLTCLNDVAGKQCRTEIRLPVRHLGAGGRPVACPGCGLPVDSSNFEEVRKNIEALKNLCSRLLSPNLGHFHGQLEPHQENSLQP